MSDNKLMSGVLVLVVLAVCIAAVPVAAKLGLLFLYIEPNPRHMPPVLTGEAIGWSIIGLLTGAFVVVLCESVIWAGRQGFWSKYRGLVAGSVIALIMGVTLGLAFAVIQMDSVDGQAMETTQLAVLAGATSGLIGTIAGIIAGAVLRRYIVSLYRLPDTQTRGRLTFNDEDATGAATSFTSGRS